IGTPSITNRIYKNAAPYNAATLAWNVASGFATVQEIQNRPYLVAGQIDNSANMLAVNSSYLFYWDGRNLKAFNKATGANVGTALTIAANTALQQGGVVADECNNVFVGSTNGTIKVYKFNGSTFDDAAAADLTITGFTTAPVYDLSYNEAMKLMYVSGRGFVASVDVSAYSCGSSTYTLSVTADCATLTATASIAPAPPTGSTITYQLYNGTLLVSSNNTGIFSGLQPNVSYSMHAIINQLCSGVQTISTFSVPAPNLSLAQTNALCGSNNGSITITASNGTAPLQYSINNGGSFQAGNVFPNLAAAVYPVLVRDANGCQNTATVTIINSNGPVIALTAFDASCNSSNGLITATGSGGTAPYQFALNNGTFQSGGNFPGLAAGTYVVTIRDATGCVNSSSIAVGNIGTTVIQFVVTPAVCGNANGNVSVIVSAGQAPYQYSLDGSLYQVNSSFTGLAAGVYT
ncbi:MAG TPA: SprB repeat-containing protein, partial [Ferruginibacter sp.]|nr:SprB repeat-containing protein [Ferruginibacter sp.]